jgi:malonyl CoA-acyl carrier protein transacylase
MGKELAGSSTIARATFDEANRIIDFDLASLCFNGPEERLNQTDISQPAIFVTSVASFRVAQEAGTIEPASIVGFAGLSLGEYTALHLAGVFSFEEGLKLVAARGRYMQQAAVSSPSGMVAILGADEAAVAKLCRECAGGEVLVAANLDWRLPTGAEWGRGGGIQGDCTESGRSVSQPVDAVRRRSDAGGIGARALCTTGRLRVFQRHRLPA